jgi:MoxR-like ATPase
VDTNDPLSQNEKDYNVGSNFFSVNVVKNSLEGVSKVYDYPRRGGHPLLNVENGILERNKDYYSNIAYFLGEKEDVKTAFIVWLLRDHQFIAISAKEMEDAVRETYTDELFAVICPENFSNTVSEYISSAENAELINNDDIKALFPKSDMVGKEVYQKIFFGAPGTGKSYKVGTIVRGHETHTFRVTFHPDSDYSTFIGSYKPVVSEKKNVVGTGYTVDDLAGILKKSYDEASLKVMEIQLFSIAYADYFNGKRGGFKFKDVLAKAGIPASYKAEMDKCVNLSERVVLKGRNEDGCNITYEFVPQTFTNAYVDAWKNPSEIVYLVIEEINRGNCAQIFGDLFQLLDRDSDGVSEYPVKADADLRTYLERNDVLGVDNGGIIDGELRLPSNFNILATMNTSDQSLFPMDSAFKRRWDWEYVPVDYSNEPASALFTITIGGNKYRWNEFLENVNEKILDLSESEDKQMGNFFVKHSLDKEEFKSKVMSYLWMEVCKDEYKHGSFFKYSEEGGGKEEEFTFNDLYPDGVKELKGFMKYIGVEPIKDK